MNGSYRECGVGLQLFNFSLDLFRSRLSLNRQRFYLRGDDRKTAPRLTGTCCLNGCIKRKKIGLLGNVGDEIQPYQFRPTMISVHPRSGLPQWRHRSHRQ